MKIGSHTGSVIVIIIIINAARPKKKLDTGTRAIASITAKKIFQLSFKFNMISL